MTTDDRVTTNRRPFRGRRYVLPSAVRRRRWSVLLLIILLLLVVFIWWLLHRSAPQAAQPAVPVTVTTVRVQSMPVQLMNIGTVTPINSVAVKANVSGQIVGTHFREGQLVRAGQLLFTIDRRPYQAAVQQAQADVLSKQALVSQAEAAVSKDQALLVQAKANKQRDIAIAANDMREAQRYLGLVRQGAVSTEQYEQYRTTAVSAQATVKADQALIVNAQAAIKSDRANVLSAKANLAASQAALKNAQVQLSYTQVTSPITGLAGNITVLNGNVERAQQDTLVTINQISPIYVSLTVPEEEFATVRRYAAANTVTAQASAPNGGVVANGGTLVFANNQVDTATGTVMLRALFANTGQKLWPGEYVNTVLTLAELPNALVVPSQAVQAGQTNQFVWIVTTNNTAYMQAVSPGQTIGNLTVIKSGLKPGQTVVTNGQLQLSQGDRVTVVRMQGL